MRPRFSLCLSSGRRGAALSRLLAAAWTDLRRLQAHAERLVAGRASAFSPEQLRALCGVLEQAAVTLRGRIAFLDDSGRCRLKDSRIPRSREKSPRLRSLIGAYRRCCRRLCRALHEAKRLGDATTAWLLSDLVRRLEKQLWLLDSRSGACRAAVLFYNF